MYYLLQVLFWRAGPSGPSRPPADEEYDPPWPFALSVPIEPLGPGAPSVLEEFETSDGW